jgi:hypothetical protein
MACVAVPGGIGCPRSDEAPYDLVSGSANPAHRSASAINAFVSGTLRLDGRCGDGELVFSTAAPGPGAAELRAAKKGVRAHKARHSLEGFFMARCFCLFFSQLPIQVGVTVHTEGGANLFRIAMVPGRLQMRLVVRLTNAGRVEGGR